MICTKCKRELPEDQFYYRKDRNRHVSWCYDCKREYDYHNNKSRPEARRTSKSKCDAKLRKTKLTAKLKDNLRSRLNNAISLHLSKGSVSHIRHLGCSIQELIVHLETQFYPDTDGTPMTWANKGNGFGTWQIDHIIPFSDADSEEDLIKIVHYTNLRPLWHHDHMTKSASERRDD